jgi:hypothetical protein
VATEKEQKGVVMQRPGITILDTREMEWEDFAGLKGSKIKVLERYDDGNPCVFLIYMPPGYEEALERPETHLHRTVHEYAYVLAGDLPDWEYESHEQQEGDFVLMRQGFFMHRSPGSIHGLEESAVSQTGLLMLFWRTGGIGNWYDDPNSAEETPRWVNGVLKPLTPPQP